MKMGEVEGKPLQSQERTPVVGDKRVASQALGSSQREKKQVTGGVLLNSTELGRTGISSYLNFVAKTIHGSHTLPHQDLLRVALDDYTRAQSERWKAYVQVASKLLYEKQVVLSEFYGRSLINLSQPALREAAVQQSPALGNIYGAMANIQTSLQSDLSIRFKVQKDIVKSVLMRQKNELLEYNRLLLYFVTQVHVLKNVAGKAESIEQGYQNNMATLEGMLVGAISADPYKIYEIQKMETSAHRS